MKRLLAFLISLVVVMGCWPVNPEVNAAGSTFTTVKIDFGGKGAAPGFLGVSASDKYDAKKGYGFVDTTAIANVDASGTGAYSDAIQFNYRDANHVFNYDLPNGLYKITVTTGDVVSTCVSAENHIQLCYLTGSCTTDSFEVPVTDNQLNFYATAGYPNSQFSISAIEIEQLSTNTTMDPTIWVYGDATVANFYNHEDDNVHSWGQKLGNYVDYDVRCFGVDDIDSEQLLNLDFINTALAYGDSDDICVIAVGISDYRAACKANSSNPDDSAYRKNLTEIVRKFKATGMQVCLVKQPGELGDCTTYPIPQKKWFSDAIDAVAAAENVSVIDLYTPWLVFCLENYATEAAAYYFGDNIHQNASGSELIAKMASEALFPTPVQVVTPAYSATYNASGTVVYETETSGGPIKNPHKGFVMTIYEDFMFDKTFEWGIGGSANNQAWNVCTICTGELFWDDLNPSEGVYDWTHVDELIEAAWANGMTYGLRIMPYASLSGSHDNYGAEHNRVPKWVYDKGAKTQRAYLETNPSIALDVPVWDDYYYIKYYKKFIQAVAEKYDGDPRVEFIDVRPFGDWGEWHCSTLIGSEMPSIDVQKDMLDFYANTFSNTLLAVTSDCDGEVYKYALSLGISKRDDGMIGSVNREWTLRWCYQANLPVVAENAGPYSLLMTNSNDPKGPLKWSETRFRECIEIAHMSIFALDQDSHCSYEFYKENQTVIDEMCNRIGYNYTVTSAKRNGNKLEVGIKNTGLAPSYFDISLCAEITDKDGNKIGTFGTPVTIKSGTFKDDTEQVYVFEYSGTLSADANICLAMYECNNKYLDGTNPNVKFDNKNNLPNNRLLLVKDYVIGGGSTSAPTPTPSTKPTNTSTPGSTGKPTTKPVVTAAPTGAVVTVKPSLVDDFAERLYTTCMDRPSDPNGKAYWIGQLKSGISGAYVAKQFFFSKEFKDFNLKNDEYVTRLYRTFMGREPDQAGLDYWLGQLGAGKSREFVFDGFVNSPEWANICLKAGIVSGGTAKPTITKAPSDETVAFATRLYTTCLCRKADQGGLDYWASELANMRRSGTEVAHGFFFSDEFKGFNLDDAEFINRLYATFMGRKADSAGFAYWKSELKNSDRETIFYRFAACQEFADICSEAGIIR